MKHQSLKTLWGSFSSRVYFHVLYLETSSHNPQTLPLVADLVLYPPVRHQPSACSSPPVDSAAHLFLPLFHSGFVLFLVLCGSLNPPPLSLRKLGMYKARMAREEGSEQHQNLKINKKWIIVLLVLLMIIWYIIRLTTKDYTLITTLNSLNMIIYWLKEMFLVWIQPDWFGYKSNTLMSKWIFFKFRTVILFFVGQKEWDNCAELWLKTELLWMRLQRRQYAKRIEYILEENLENLSVWILSVPFSLKGSSKFKNHVNVHKLYAVWYIKTVCSLDFPFQFRIF